MSAWTLNRYLDDLERRIDPAVEDALWNDWIAFCDGRFVGDIFSPRRRSPHPPAIDWPEISINAAVDDFDAMAVQQFRSVSNALASASGEILCVRSNYGSSILPSVFGAKIFVMAEETQTLPTSHPIAGGVNAIRSLIDRGVPDLRDGFGARTLDMAERFNAILASRPNLSRHIHQYHPDLQGPMDVCEVLWGSSLFIDIIDHPDVVHALLSLITDTYIRFMTAWLAIVPSRTPYAVHWSMLHRGQIMLRNDSAMNFSPAMYDEFIRPYNQRLLDTFGGGADHFCGRGDHTIASATSTPHLYAVQLSQPHLNDMETILRHTVDRGIKLIGLDRDPAERALASGRDLHGCVHCM
jgi:hypothetical protein